VRNDFRRSTSLWLVQQLPLYQSFSYERPNSLPRSSVTRPVNRTPWGDFTPIKTSSSHTRWPVHSSRGKPAHFEAFLALTVLTSSTIPINTSEYVVRPPRRCKKTAASQKANSRQNANQSRGRRMGRPPRTNSVTNRNCAAILSVLLTRGTSRLKNDRAGGK
jgi:hypothetical protein